MGGDGVGWEGGGKNNIFMKGIAKVAIFTKTEGFPVSQKIFLLGVIFQNVFSPMAAGPAAPGFWGKSEDPFGGSRTIWR